ncbi:MAG TPA: O-antigen ligase family protein [Bdellovibrionota bacterium]|nr:O-antigen ligase family protein [Bdellovibrionota bacterium]
MIIVALLLVTLMPYFKPNDLGSFFLNVPEQFSYALALGLISLLPVGLLASGKITVADLRSAFARIPWFWFYVALLMLACLVRWLSGVGSLNFQGFARLYSYIVTGAVGLFVVPMLIDTRERFLFWLKGIALISSLVGIAGVMGVMEVEPFSSWILRDEMMEFINLPSTASVFFEPNIFGSVMMFGAIVSTYLLLTTSQSLFSLSLYLVAIAANLGGVFVSWSRAAWLCLAVAGGLVVLSYMPKFVRAFLVVSALAATVGVCFWLSYQESPLKDALMLEDVLTGRPELWLAGLFAMVERPLWGLGLSHIDLGEVLQRAGHNHITTHQVFIDQGVMSGLPVMFAYGWLFVSVFHRLQVMPKLQHSMKLFFVCLFSAIFLFIQFSPHNIGGTSFFAFQMTVLIGLIFSPNFRETHHAH